MVKNAQGDFWYCDIGGKLVPHKAEGPAVVRNSADGYHKEWWFKGLKWREEDGDGSRYETQTYDDNGQRTMVETGTFKNGKKSPSSRIKYVDGVMEDQTPPVPPAVRPL